MPDLTVLAGIGSVIWVVGAVTLVVAVCRRPRPPVLPTEEHVGWEGHMDELRELAAPTEVMPAVQPEPPTTGRHWYPGTAEDSGAIPRHGWRPGEQTGAGQ